MKITHIILHHKNQWFWAGLSLKYVAISGARSLQITRYRPDTSAELWSGRHLQDPVKKNDFSRKVSKTYKISPFPSHLHPAIQAIYIRANILQASEMHIKPSVLAAWNLLGAVLCDSITLLAHSAHHAGNAIIYMTSRSQYTPPHCRSKTLMKSHLF